MRVDHLDFVFWTSYTKLLTKLRHLDAIDLTLSGGCVHQLVSLGVSLSCSVWLSICVNNAAIVLWTSRTKLLTKLRHLEDSSSFRLQFMHTISSNLASHFLVPSSVKSA